jgi:photosynthetic reaction center H subunit
MEPFFSNFDLAQLSLYLFWAFFIGLIIYLQRENMREGYPLENESGEPTSNQGPFSPADKKTFKLPHGRGDVSVPNGDGDKRDLKLEQKNVASGSPLFPTGDPMDDGLGAGAWAERRDVPELDAHGNPKLQPMKSLKGFNVSAGRDPRGMDVVAADGEKVAVVSDLWIDVPEQLVRYLEIELNDKSKRLLPVPLSKINKTVVDVHSLYGKHFPKVPKNKKTTEVTLLEEEKISAYYTGGKLYAAYDRYVSPV